MKKFILLLCSSILCSEYTAFALDDIEFNSKNIGRIKLSPLKNKEKIEIVLEDYRKSSSISSSLQSSLYELEKASQHLYLQFEESSQRHDFNFFEVYKSGNFFGLAGISYTADELRNAPKIHCYLVANHQQEELAKDINFALVDYAFNIGNFDVVETNIPSSGLPLSTLGQLGYIASIDSIKEPQKQSYPQNIYKLTRNDRGLFLLSEIIKKDSKKFIPKIHSMPSCDMERSGALWFTYFKKGIPLSNGGVEESFITAKDLSESPNLQGFNMYRSDRSLSVTLNEQDIKKFLLEDNVFSPSTRLDDLSIKFSLGSHEGFTRLARCIYKTGYNQGILYPVGGYGFLAFAATALRPLSYDVNLININRKKGEKIITSDLECLVKKYPKSKTLYLEQKTTCGALYTAEELEDIILLCKKHNLFFIMDMAHIGTELYETSMFPDFVGLCQKNNFQQFAGLYTGSKTYGLERARIGFIILDKNSNIHNLPLIIERDLYRVLGSTGDTPFEVAQALISSPVAKRQQYKKYFSERRRFNMNLMLAYIEGVESERIDPDLRQSIKEEVEPFYQQGIEGIQVVYKPEVGLHLKVDTSELQNKYFSNIRMYNSEIFSYVLNKIAGVTSLHSYQILDEQGFGMRLSFSIRDYVPEGMKRIHNFVNLLSDQSSVNRFLPDISNIEDIIFIKDNKKEEIILKSREEVKKLDLLDYYKKNVQKQTPSYIKLTNSDLDLAINNAAHIIQRAWNKYKKSK